jgi:hypothetical protein
MRSVVLTLLLILVPGSAFADSIINGGFETGNFTGWSTIGDAIVLTSALGTPPAGGTYQALVTTAPGCLFPDSCNVFTYSGNRAFPFFTVIPNPMVDLLGVSGDELIAFTQSILGPSGFPSEASVIRTEFTANAGDVIAFDMNYLADLNNERIDFAFYSLDSNLGFLRTVSQSDGLSPTPFVFESGYQPYFIRVPTSGSHFLALAIWTQKTHRSIPGYSWITSPSRPCQNLQRGSCSLPVSLGFVWYAGECGNSAMP